MHKIIVTGPESSGKTTLSKSLSKHLNGKLVNEFARNYLLKNNNTYNFENLLEIAQNQYKLENQKSKIIVCDTDLLTIKIWSEYKFGKKSYFNSSKELTQYDTANGQVNFSNSSPSIPNELDIFFIKSNSLFFIFPSASIIDSA